MTARLARLLIGLILYGVGCGVMVQAQIGVDPWTVFAQGLSVQTGVGIGWITNLVGLLVLLLWISAAPTAGHRHPCQHPPRRNQHAADDLGASGDEWIRDG
jgi:uncharacterized membrane protein YczE